uniref:Solute carrier family 25 member 32a n=1 Tax=Eptatretus burgeri TaxID=7764 RepID=A0A8C4NFK6_EPTBU
MVAGPYSEHRLWEAVSTARRFARPENLVAGTLGGVVATLMLHPLDLVKIRFAVSDGLSSRPKYRGLVHCMGSIWRQQGLRGLYQGVAPNVCGSGASWGLYFFFYQAIKAYKQEGRSEPLGPTQHMISAAEAGAATLSFTNPIWVTKTRLVLQYENVECQRRYHGMFDALTKIYKHEGIRGLYKSTHEYLSMAALSKTFAVASTYPYQVVRARLQDQHTSYAGVWDVMKCTWRNEGLRGFYKGMVPNILRVTPACCITFVVYEQMSHLLRIT